MNKLVFVLLVSLAVGFAQQVEKKSEEATSIVNIDGRRTVEKEFELKYLQGDRANRAIQFVTGIMTGRARIHWDPVLHETLMKDWQKYWPPKVTRPWMKRWVAGPANWRENDLSENQEVK